jgi:spermidine/putrescine-binding protein
LLFDPKKSIGSFLLMDDARAMIGAALKYKGYSLNCTDKKQLKEARDVLIESKKRSIGFDGGVGIKNKVLAKVCRLGVVYNGHAVRGMKYDPDTYYFVPREGTEIWLDNMGIPAKAPNRAMAEKLMVDSVRHWFAEYGIDGMRFDMMGDATRDAVQRAFDAAKAINPRVVFLGEGWRMVDPTRIIAPKVLARDASQAIAPLDFSSGWDARLRERAQKIRVP